MFQWHLNCQEQSNTNFWIKTCLEINLISRLYSLSELATSEEILEKFRCFEGLGCLSTEYKIQLDKDAKPVVHPPRKIPFAMKNKVKDELSRLERIRVIENVSEPTEWVNSLVVVEKPNKKVRLCLDPRDLNKRILRGHYPEPRNKKELQRFMGTVNYLGKFISNSSRINQPL